MGGPFVGEKESRLVKKVNFILEKKAGTDGRTRMVNLYGI